MPAGRGDGWRWLEAAEALFCDATRTLPDRNAASGSPVHIFYLALTHTGLKLRAVINETKLLI